MTQHSEMIQSNAYKDILDNHPDLIVKTDLEGLILYANHSFHEMMGRNAPSYGQPLFILDCGQQKVDLARELGDLLAPPYQAYREYCVTITRECLWIGWMIKTIQNDIGAPLYILWSGRDITRQKTLEAAVHDQKERFELAFEGANDGLYDWDFKTGQIYHSPRWSEIFGFPKDKDTHHIDDWKAMVHPDDLPDVLKQQEDHFSGKSAHYIAEYRVKNYNGTWQWILSRGRAVCDDTGTPLRMAGSNTDITELRLNQEKVRDMSSLFKATLDTIPDIIGIQDNQHNILQYNEAGYRFFKFDGEDIAGHKCYCLLNRNSPCPQCSVLTTLQTGQPVHKEQYNASLSRWFDVRTYPVFDESGSVSRVVEHIRDITDLKQTEEDLQRSNSILKAQQEAAIDGIIVVDENRYITEFNRRFLEIWDIPEKMLEGRESNTLLLDVSKRLTDPEGFLRKIAHLYAHPWETSRDELYFKNGKALDRYSAPVLAPNGTCYGRIWYFRDITAIKNNEQALQESIASNARLLADIVELDRYKTEFFSNISHELRTPINVIFSTLQLMELRMQSGESIDDSSGGRYVIMMKQNCYRMLRLINNLIDITKFDAGFYEVTLKNYNIVSVVEDITVSVADYIKNHGITLLFDTEEEEIIMACDAEKIERIMLNLLSNAIKFTSSGGSIQVNILRKPHTVQISVKDTGTGIPVDKLDTIFQRFTQVNSSLTRDNEGSGIGLSLVKSLIEMHQGSISVNSVHGEGSEFLIELPLSMVDHDGSIPEMGRISHQDSRIDRINIEFSDIYGVNS